MDLKEALIVIRGSLDSMQNSGKEFVYIPSLRQYLDEIEKNAPMISQTQKLQHESNLALAQATNDSNLELFRSMIETAKTALTSSVLINGGAAVALLAFIGNLTNAGASVELRTRLLLPMVSFAVGVLAGAVGAGTSYLTQHAYLHGPRTRADWMRIVSVFFVVGAYLLFGVGIFLAYKALS